MRTLKTSLLLCLLPLIADSLWAQGCDTERHREFDFWVGDWAVSDAAGKVVGENLVERILGDCVVTEHWKGSGGSEGRSFNMFFARDDKWHQTWVDNNGTRLDLQGGLDAAGSMVLSGEMPAAEGGMTLHEISWTPKQDGSVVQHWRATQNGGETWSDLFVGTYRRKE